MSGKPDATEAGRAATRPSHFGWADWKSILGRVFVKIGEHNLSLIAAGIAFYTLLSLFPAIAAFVGIYGLIADPSDVPRQLAAAEGLMPAEAYDIVEGQVQSLAASGSGKLGLASALAIILALIGARNGVNSLILGLNIVYGEANTRGIVAGVMLALGLTALLLVVGLVAVTAVLVMPAVLNIFQLGLVTEWLASVIRWPILIVAFVIGLGVLYRYGPDRANARLSWVSWGAVIATLMWLVASALFSIYVGNFASYNKTYGSLGAVVGLMMWFWLSAFIMLLGAELNAEMERHTRRDTTVGKEKPEGERGAFVADNPAE